MCCYENPNRIYTIARGDNDLKQHSRYHNARMALLFWTLFIGIGAVLGACMMFIDPTGRTTGMAGMLPYFQKLPFASILFRDFTFSGCALLIVNGLTNLTAAGLLIANRKTGILLGGIFGVTLMLWICIQFYMFPANFMSTSFFVFGLCQAVTGYMAWIFQKQEAFARELVGYSENCAHIGADPSRLVVYFSRMGYGKKLAYTEANRTGAVLYEIQSTERTEETLGFWWCGRYGMHRWEMPIRPIPDLSVYSHVTICTPIWVFALSAPVRAFCHAASGQIREVDYVLVHHTCGRYENAVREMDTLLGIQHTGYRSIQCHTGTFHTVFENEEKP